MAYRIKVSLRGIKNTDGSVFIFSKLIVLLWNKDTCMYNGNKVRQNRNQMSGADGPCFREMSIYIKLFVTGEDFPTWWKLNCNLKDG